MVVEIRETRNIPVGMVGHNNNRLIIGLSSDVPSVWLCSAFCHLYA